MSNQSGIVTIQLRSHSSLSDNEQELTTDATATFLIIQVRYNNGHNVAATVQSLSYAVTTTYLCEEYVYIIN